MQIRDSPSASFSGSEDPRPGQRGRHRRTVGRGVAMSLLVLTLSSCNWLVYHGDLTGSGMDSSGSSFAPAHQAWVSANLGGKLYGEPLVVGTDVFVATENDAVVALSAATGAVVWSTTVGTAVPAGDLPCGDIGPTVGITSTPVVDTSRNEIFVVADELVGGLIQHHLFGLNLSDGAVLMNQAVDPPGSDPKAQLQRVALTLDAGQVVFGFGGNSGDCSTYHGWLVAVPEAGGASKTFQVDSGPGESQGAIWMGGAAPIVDSQGNIWVATGNGSNTHAGDPYDDSDGVLELSSSLSLLQYFAPGSWTQDNLTDADLGSSSPAVLPNGLVFQAGKSGTGYLLKQSALGGIGGQVAQLPSLCGGVVDGGDAFANSIVYAPCGGGIAAVKVGASPPSLTRLWQTSSGSSGPPIIAGGTIWTIGGTTLFGLDPTTGSPVHQFPLGTEANHFPTPSVGDGLLLAPASDRVFAFTTPPATQVAAPPNGATVKGSQWLDASASSAIGVNRVEFHLTGGALNNVLIGTATSTTYGWLYRWDSTTVANGAYFLQSVAYDTTGVSATSTATGITVKN
jgi:polyvinyl alcohol dehydrogenase (cytochrome)